jgi:hypothetical protein
VATRTARRRLFQHPWRVAIVAVALLAVVNLAIILLATADTSSPDRASLPDVIESITPGQNELTGLVDDVSVDLLDNLTGVLVIDGVEIPEDQLARVPELGVITFRPGPDKELSRFRAGDNTVVVRYWERTRERPASPASFGWTFRAAA